MGRNLIRAFGIAAVAAVILVFVFGPDEERPDGAIASATDPAATDPAVDEATRPNETADAASRTDASVRADDPGTLADSAGDPKRRAAGGTQGSSGESIPQGAATDAVDTQADEVAGTTVNEEGTDVETAQVSDAPAGASRAVATDGLPNGDAAAPRIDTLRIEPDGLTLLSGLTTPDTDVQVALGPDLVAEGRSGPDGSFVLYGKVPQSAAPGPLEVRSIDPDGGIRLGAQTFIVEPPRRIADAGGDMITRAPTPPSALPDRPRGPETDGSSPDRRLAAAPQGARPSTVSDVSTGIPDTATGEVRDPRGSNPAANPDQSDSKNAETASDAGTRDGSMPPAALSVEPGGRSDAATAVTDATDASARSTRTPADPDGQGGAIAAEDGMTQDRPDTTADTSNVMAESGATMDDTIATASNADIPPSIGARVAEGGTSSSVDVDLSRADIGITGDLNPTRPTAPGAPDTIDPSKIEADDAGLAMGSTGPSPARQASRPEAPRVLRVEEGGLSVVQGGPTAPLSIDSISYNAGGSTVLGGRAPGDADVRVYIDNTPVDAARSGPDGQWRLDLPRLEERVYTLRVDQIDADGTVVARAETPFKPEDAATLDALVATDADGIRRVTVQPGFTLWAIAERNYGDGLAYVKVFEANATDIRDPDLIYPGQIFDVPR